jgi:hypothetical protein
MKKNIMIIAGLAAAGLAYAENLDGVDRMVCAAAQVQVCIEYDTCYAAAPMDLDIPEFVVIDIDDKTVSTTKASNENRSTTFTSVKKEDGTIYLQGVEGGRAFGFVIDEASGRMTVAVSRDGMTVSVFGACTDADL